MAAHNISPETVMTDLSGTVVDLNYGLEGKPEKLVGFRREQPSVLS